MDNNILKLSWINVISIGGAFAAYHIGSGFASGAEVLQFFGSWGGYWPFLTCIIGTICVTVFVSMCLNTGRRENFKSQIDLLQYIGGKHFGYFLDAFTLIIVAGIGVAMFAGSGATINQYFGIPVQVGTIVLGIIASIVVCMGLKSVINVLGIGGILIVLFVVGFGLYSVFTAKIGLFESQANLSKYVEEGKVLQAGIFGIYNPVFISINYVGMMFANSFFFTVTLGAKKTSNNKKEILVSGIFSGVFYFLGALLVAITVLLNLDFIIGQGAEVPMLAAIDNSLPWISGVFAIIIFIGILTTITGYLWLIAGRFASDKTLKFRIIVIACTIVGVFFGSVLPFNMVINYFYPFSGLIGLLIFVLFVVKEISLWKKTKSVINKDI